MSTYSDFTTDATAIRKGTVSIDTANPINQITFEVGAFTHIMNSVGNFSLDGRLSVANGTNLAPSYSFASNPMIGMYRSALDE